MPFGTTMGRVAMLGDCASITTCVTIDSRSDPTSSRCQISVSHRAPARSLTARARTRNFVRRTSVDFEELNEELRFEIRDDRSQKSGCSSAISTGGARRDRTDDLLLAKQALSQLSYGPFRDQSSGIRDQVRKPHCLIPDP